ncbi:hypothetical protein ACFW16_33910 [Inquilinus sp. NPDC058860]|uniref:hypothetical protein n=1 Tax=Inquilinus sp. NPDC058860 TaxID=3346652 RepID=UPI0036CED5B2
MTRLSPVTWGVIALGLVGLPASLLLPDDRAAPARAVERPSAAALAAEDPEEADPVDAPAPRLVSIDRLTDTSARPLFAPTRRPAPPAPPVAEAPPPVPEAPPEPPPPPPVDRTDYALVGIVSGRGGVLAILRPRAGGPAVTVRAGDDIGGWHVETISDTSIHLTGGADERWMRLFTPQRAAGGPADPDDPAGAALQ